MLHLVAMGLPFINDNLLNRFMLYILSEIFFNQYAQNLSYDLNTSIVKFQGTLSLKI